MKATLVSSFLPFPNICWWAYASAAHTVLFDYAEHFEKMSYRNRYYLPGANNVIQQSIPLVYGRNQRTPVKDVRISNTDKWQVQHWRTLFSLYNRSPYFQHYSTELETFFTKEFSLLTEFNKASVHWLKKQMGFSFEEVYTNEYHKEYPYAVDLRNMKPSQNKKSPEGFPEYYQVFSDRTGFVPNMSALDLLFAEGPYAKKWIDENREKILSWQSA